MRAPDHLPSKMFFKIHKKTNSRFFSEAKPTYYSKRRGFSQEYLDLTRKLKRTTLTDSHSREKISAIQSVSLARKQVSTIQRTQQTPAKQESTLAFAPIKNALKITASPFTSTQNKFNKKMFKKSRYSIFNEDFMNSKYMKSQNNLKIDEENNEGIEGIVHNAQRLWKIRKALNEGFVKEKLILESIKFYVMDKGKFSKMEAVFIQTQVQNEFKEFIALERCFVIGLADIIARDQLHKMTDECQTYLNNIFGFYKHLMKIFEPLKLPAKKGCQVKYLMDELIVSHVEERSSLTSTTIYLSTRIHHIYQFNLKFYHEIVKEVLRQAQQNKIVKTFYNILTNYAKYLNDNDIFLTQKPGLNNLATVPSPYILVPRKYKNYSLIVDLDETLIHCSFGHGHYQIKERPYCREFIENLSKFYEIIIFTSSMASYAEEVVENLKNISYVLSREHTIRCKGEFIKDLSRIGRSIETMIIVDNLRGNFRLQRANGIQIKSWVGDEKDLELRKLETFLIEIAQKKPLDVREALEELAE